MGIELPDPDEKLFNRFYEAYLDGTFAKSEEDANKAVVKFITMWGALSKQERFALVCTVFDWGYQMEINNNALMGKLATGDEGDG